MFRHLRQQWQDLFAAEFDVLLYDLTSTYFEGLCRDNPKARHGYPDSIGTTGGAIAGRWSSR